jgi:hypothetical protein
VSVAFGAPVRVLFIGNSYTYVNNLPRMVEAIGEANGIHIDARMIAKGGYTLEAHAADKVDDRLAGIDVVVLQEQSHRPVDAPEKLLAGAKKLVGKTRARVVYFVVWAHRDRAQEQTAIDSGYDKAARATGGTLSPVGDAWQLAISRNKDLKLHWEDGSHPLPEGSYLAALILFQTVTGAPAVKLPRQVMGRPVTMYGSMGDKEEVLVDLSADELAFLKRIIADVSPAAR